MTLDELEKLVKAMTEGEYEARVKSEMLESLIPGIGSVPPHIAIKWIGDDGKRRTRFACTAERGDESGPDNLMGFAALKNSALSLIADARAKGEAVEIVSTLAREIHATYATSSALESMGYRKMYDAAQSWIQRNGGGK